MASLLVIDDDVQVTELLQKHFTEAGHQVTVAHRGEEGMAAVQRATPDLILLDVILPDLTGFQMCSRLRSNPSTSTTPILMITAAARYPNQQVFGLERGANAYLLKPFDLVELGETVERYLNPPPEPSPMAPKKVITPMPSAEPAPTLDISRLRNFLRNAILKTKQTP